MPVSWQTRLPWSSAISTLRWIVSRARSRRTPRPCADRAVLVSRSRLRPFRRSVPGPPPEDRALEERVSHHPISPVRPTCDLAAGEDPFERRLGALVDDEAA